MFNTLINLSAYINSKTVIHIVDTLVDIYNKHSTLISFKSEGVISPLLGEYSSIFKRLYSHEKY